MAWERAVAVCYCFIQEFIRLKCTSKGKPKWIRNQAELEELTYEFYLYASSELRTQFSSLHMFSEIFKAYPSDYFVPPLVPKHKETLSQIDNRIDQLLEFSATWTEKMKNIYVKKEKRMNVQKVIQSQYLASLAMMRQVIELCPAAMWDDRAVKNRYWQVAYHGLFFIHFYLQPTEADFVPWEKHQPHYDDMGIGGDKEPCNQADMLAYLALVEEQVRSVVPILDLEAESGFHWLPFNKLELQFYSMRHLMGHVGELSERLWVQAGVEVEWVGKGE
jgi:hypothetical protein